MTAFQIAQLHDIRQDRKAQTAAFSATGAIAEIGVCSNFSGHFTTNLMNGKPARNRDNWEFSSELEAAKSYARDLFSGGKLKKTNRGTYLVFA